MIRFQCEHCCRKIVVKDEHANKQGKCPECGKVVVIPGESTVIEFQCEECGQKISVPKIHAGKKALCPKCKAAFVVPGMRQRLSNARRSNKPDSQGELTLVDVPEQYKIKHHPTPLFERALEQHPELERHSPLEDTESKGQRTLPWLLDIFLYPTSAPGLVHLVIFTLVPFFTIVAARMLGRVGMYLGFFGWIVRILIGLYMAWYLAECVRDSAKGGTRAPEAFALEGTGEMYSQALHIVGCYIIFVFPAILYSVYTQRQDAIFWGLVSYGVFFFPMGLLACIMFDSIRGLNPILLIGSIFSTFFQYCAIVLLIGGIVLAIWAVGTVIRPQDTQQPLTMGWRIIQGLLSFIGLYIIFVIAHLLGRFYWRFQEKLNWEV